jgi:hypothetical protein
LEGIQRIAKTSVNITSHDLSPGSSEYEAGALTMNPKFNFLALRGQNIRKSMEISENKSMW